jgi:DNA-binding transcriptional ArsR family regulator
MYARKGESEPMDENSEIVNLAQALADPLRLNILQYLMEGSATVSELISFTGASQSKVSNHLTLLRERNLVRAKRHGRHITYTLRDASVGQLIESLSLVAGTVPIKYWKSPQIITARTCYDHLAGRYGVALFDALLQQQAITAPTTSRDDIELGPHATEIFAILRLDLASLHRQHRRFAFACPDWTEHHPHLGGALGAEVWTRLVEHGWLVKQPGSRVTIVTDEGKLQLQKHFGIQLQA